MDLMHLVVEQSRREMGGNGSHPIPRRHENRQVLASMTIAGAALPGCTYGTRSAEALSDRSKCTHLQNTTMTIAL